MMREKELGRIRLLYIEDDAEQRIKMTRDLRAAGFAVTPVSSGRKGVRLFRTRTFDAVLCDLNMPETGGADVLKAIKKTGSETPFIILTAHGTISQAVRALRNGADHFILKPGNINEVTNSFIKLIEKKDLENQLKKYSMGLEKMVEERTEGLAYAIRQLEALNKASRKLGRMRDENRLFDIAPMLLTASLDFDRAYLCTVDNEKVHIHSFCPGKGPKKPIADFVSRVNSEKVKLPPQILESFKKRRTIFIPDIMKMLGGVKAPSFFVQTRSVVISPVRIRGTGKSIVVIIGSMNDHERDMDRNDVSRFETFVNMVGLSLENIRVYRSLEDKVKKRTESLKTANIELKDANRNIRETQSRLVQSEKMASLGMLVAGIAHEINTPIGAISSMHDTLVRSVAKLKENIGPGDAAAPEKTAQLKKILEIIDESNSVIGSGSDRVVNIVKRLRSFARLDEAELKTVDLHEGLEDTLTLVHHELKRGITVNRNYGEIPAIACYPGQLNQVFLNIIINAKQAMNGEGIIDISTSIEGRNVCVRFDDTGKGIPEDKIARVFDPGFTTKGVGVGTGLGLSICYQIMQDHHGSIRAGNRKSGGASFTICLPMDLEKLMEKN